MEKLMISGINSELELMGDIKIGERKDRQFNELLREELGDDLMDRVEDCWISVAGVLRGLGISAKFHERIREYGAEARSIHKFVNNFSEEEKQKIANSIIKVLNESESIIGSIFEQVYEAIKSLKKIGVYHLDIASRNIMVDKSGNLVLIDFGISQILSKNEEFSEPPVKYVSDIYHQAFSLFL
jgi:serine/threonine protein kinase